MELALHPAPPLAPPLERPRTFPLERALLHALTSGLSARRNRTPPAGKAADGAAEVRALAEFRRAYAQAGAPALLVLWQAPPGSAIEIVWKRRAARAVSEQAPAGAAAFDAAFREALAAARVELADPGALARMLPPGRGRAQRPRTLDAAAVAQCARYVVLLSLLPGAGQEAGVARVTVLETRSGVVLTDLLAREMAHAPVATPAGPPDTGTAGRRAAQALLGALTARWQGG
ncbi:MAG: hypothetical protein ACXU8N_16925 [Telluria sp.]